MHAGFWNKTSDFHCRCHPMVFAVNDMDVTERKKKQMHEFFGYRQFMHGMTKR